MHIFIKPVKKIVLPGLLFLAVSSQLYAQNQDSLADNNIVSSVQAVSRQRVNGTVLEASTKKPLPGISISVAGYSAALTDEMGNFKITVPDYRSVLLISGSGYQTKEVALKGRTNVSISLFEESYSSVYDAAVLPFSTSLKNRTPYSVSSINTNGSWSRANETPDTYLQGKIPGLNVVTRSGTPDIGADLYLRGYNSLYGATQPLVVVDGIIYDINSYGNSIIQGHQTNHFANIDLKDIDNVTLIKDAGAMYGTRGANGVLLITTGRAKDVATRLDFAAYGGFNGSVTKTPVMQADNYRVYLSDLLKTRAGATDAQILAEPYMNDDPQAIGYQTYHQNTNWQDKVMDGGYSQNYYLKVTGGDDIATYALSMGFLNNEGLTQNTDLTRYQTRFNANLNLSQKLKAQVNLAFTRSEQNLRDQAFSKTSPLYLALIKVPFLASNELSETGIVSPNLSNTDIFGVSNPSAAVANIQAINRNYRFVGSAGFNYTFNKSFSANTMTGVTYDKIRENYFAPEIGIAPETLATDFGRNKSAANVQRLFSVYNDTWVSYQHAFDRHNNISANLGFRYQTSKSEADNGLSYNTASDEFVGLGGAQSTLRVIGGSLGNWNWLNNYLNINYTAFDKYFLSLNIAADASSRFGKDIPDVLTINGNKYAVLPSLAASWLISSEDFMANNKVIESLKLRASYGLSGNDDIGNYSAKQYYVSQNFLGRQGLIRGNIGNTALKWETTTKLNGGLDAAFLNERLNLSLDVYHNKISDMLIYEPIITSAGFKSILTNNGEMNNTGLEVAAMGRLINRNAFKWDMGFTIAFNKNEVTALPDNQSLITSYAGANILTQVGSPANLFYGYKTDGVYTSDAEAFASGLLNKTPDGNFLTFNGGDVRFANTNNDNVIDDSDRQIIGDPNPDFIGSYSNKVSYKRWSFDALLTFSYGNDIYNGTRAILESMTNYDNQTLAVVNRWRTDGQITNTPRAVWGDPAQNSRFSDRWIEDGSYLRLRTISLSYNVPVKASFLKSVTVYATANNLFTISKYLGYDPEFSSGTSIFARGIDTGLEPQFKSTQLGIRIGL